MKPSNEEAAWRHQYTLVHEGLERDRAMGQEDNIYSAQDMRDAFAHGWQAAKADQPAPTETSGCRMACGCARCVERRGRHEDWLGITPSGVPIAAETAPQGAPAREPCLCCSDTLVAPSGNPCPLCLPEQAC
jgi:hypothetical protein